ncbi:hypothetical protein J1605_019338 [Eschrichtius robustus]|uniref:Outer dense fiber protein 2-like n=1 Tax=Eschrichtius robustus TaxID=9764 RepID=A0AB34HSN1_ESCRO|nr:hypothetical protein J1605_019338 [Eschrichtius robustus]
MEATFKEAELATCSVELLLPLFKDTIEEISFENRGDSLSNLLEKLADNESENTSLETKISEWNLQLKKSTHEAVTMKESSRQKAIALKKASKIYKQRIKHFTGDMENLTSQIREQEAKLSETVSASNAWKSHYEKIVIEKTELEFQIETMKK